MKTSSPLALDLSELKDFSATARPAKAPEADNQVLPISDNQVPLSPVPVPPMAEPPPETASLHLTQTEPMDSPEAVALQVALLTSTVADLMGRLAALENDRWQRQSR